MTKSMNRRSFIRNTALGSIGLGLASQTNGADLKYVNRKKKVGIIGLDTSHSIAFTEAMNVEPVDPLFSEFRVVAAYPRGSKNIKSSVERIPKYIEDVKGKGVEIVDSIEELLEKCDYILLETNDGHPHLEQAISVMRAGKPVFIDKPVAASIVDAIAIYKAAKHFKVPMFSASSLRYITGAAEVADGVVGKVLGADTYSPSHLEKTHPDLFWYGVHGVETLFTVMGAGCKTVTRVFRGNNDKVVGVWEDNRIGSFRGLMEGGSGYGGVVFGEKGIYNLGPYNGYNPLLAEILKFFNTGISPIPEAETLEIYTFMEAADESKRQKGAEIAMEKIYAKAEKGAVKRLEQFI